MAFLFQLIVLGIFIMIGFQLWNAMNAKRGRVEEDGSTRTIDGTAQEVSSPGGAAAQTLKDFENARAELKHRYPAVFAMLGGYLNSHTISEAGSLEAAVREMIADWRARRDEVSRELTRLLGENETEEECRAIVLAACDAEFDSEGYRPWLTWLLGQFNSFKDA